MKKFKRTISIVLVLITIFSTVAITANAASYSLGNYSVAGNSGSYVRYGAGTNYSKVGAASKGTTFYVSKVNGNWGYTSSIKCTNGTRSGWICLDYCSYKGSGNSSRATYNDVFASLKGSGYSLSQARNSESTSFKKGDFVYVWAFLHDANNNLYKTYGSGTCNMTLSIYRPDGSCAYTYTYKNSDNNWIGQRLDKAGTWKIQSKITGSLSGTNTRTITVKETSTTKYYTLSYNGNGGYNQPSSQTVKADTAFNISSSKPTRSGYTFLGWSTNKNATTASYVAGTRVKINSNITLYAVWKKNSTVKNVSYYVEITANSGLVLRSGAGTSYSYLTAIPKGTTVKITQENNGWGKTTYNGKTGWISLSYTKKTSNNSSAKVSLNVPLFKQGDSRWKNVYIGTKTIGNVGCLTTSIAMVYSYKTGKTVYPNTMRNMLSYSNNDLYWSSLTKVGLTSKVYNSSVTNNMLSTIYSKLKEGKPVIIGANTSSGSYQHWVVITGYIGSSTTSFSTADFTVNDPGVQGSTTLKAFLANGSNADRNRVIRIIY